MIFTKMRLYALCGTAIIAGAILLFYFSPAQYGFYPRCGLYTVTGLECPGCGGLRAAHSLLHGEIGQAFNYNPLLVMLMPGVVVVGSLVLIRKAAGKGIPAWMLQPLWLWLFLAAALIFMVARNLFS